MRATRCVLCVVLEREIERERERDAEMRLACFLLLRKAFVVVGGGAQLRQIERV